MKKEKPESIVEETAQAEPSEAELIARRQAVLAQYGIVDQRQLTDTDNELPSE